MGQSFKQRINLKLQANTNGASTLTLNRRQLVKSSLASIGLATLSACRFNLSKAEPTSGNEAPQYDYILTAEPSPLEILPGKTTPGLGFNGQFPAPVIRAQQGKAIRILFVNNLSQATTIHWHGIRIDIKMDGVPFLSQAPVQPGETFLYEFVCPDAGTFWYHPHMHSVEQLGKGLVGALIVDEAEAPEFDADLVIGLKDWRLDKQGQFLPLSIPRHAARAGTLGTVESVNGEQRPTLLAPAGGLVRLRFLNMDSSRVYHLSLKDLDAHIIAIDGSPVAKPRPLVTHDMGAGMRLDVAIRLTKEVGQDIVIYDKKGRGYFELCRLQTEAPKQALLNTELRALAPNPLPSLKLEEAQHLRFEFEWAGALSPVGHDGKVDQTFWTINRRAWAGMHSGTLPAPLAVVPLGKTIVMELHNATPHGHPIHMHGIIFTVLSSDKRTIDPFQTDTVLLERNERATIAFVADNPGRWMFHCHVIEHMKTGLMGYITIA